MKKAERRSAMNPKHVVALIMAGGKGERFWPLSRQSSPKQFLRLLGSNSLIQETAIRVMAIVPPDGIYVVTGRGLSSTVKHHIEAIPGGETMRDNVILEPEGRDTAPCIALASLAMKNDLANKGIDEDPVMIVLPSDHVVSDTAKFVGALRAAVNTAWRTKGLVTIGISPTRPETKYGYLELGDAAGPSERKPRVYQVARFTEKPSEARALAFLSSGKHLWNSGIFAWRLSVITEALVKYLPGMRDAMQALKQRGLRPGADPRAFADAFSMLPRISIDYGVMEKAGSVYAVRGDFGWDDVGTWSALSRLHEPDGDGNVVLIDPSAGRNGIRPLTVDSKKCLVYANDRLVACVGVEDLIVVDTGDVVLVCRRDEEHRLRTLLASMRTMGLHTYL